MGKGRLTGVCSKSYRGLDSFTVSNIILPTLSVWNISRGTNHREFWYSTTIEMTPAHSLLP